MYGQDQRKVGTIWPNKSSYSGINEVCEIDGQNVGNNVRYKGKIFFGICAIARIQGRYDVVN